MCALTHHDVSPASVHLEDQSLVRLKEDDSARRTMAVCGGELRHSGGTQRRVAGWQGGGGVAAASCQRGGTSGVRVSHCKAQGTTSSQDVQLADRVAI